MSRLHAWAVALDFDLTGLDELLKGRVVQILVRNPASLERPEVKDFAPGERHTHR